MRPRIVLLTGEPGSGKTTLGLALADLVGLPFVARDHVRRSMWLTSGVLPPRDEATDAFLSIVGSMAGLGVSCIVEYVVRAQQPEHLDRLLAVGDVVVVRVSCADPVARRTVRGADDAQEAHMREVAAAMRTDFPAPVLRVRSDDGWDPSLEVIAEFAVSRSGA